jgi:sugar lactone lactonase YvrE
VPDYAAWGPDGSLYVTDYQQAVIWRVPRGGGRARIWLADRRLDGDQFGTAAIVLGPGHRTLYFTQQSSAGLGDGNPTTGKLYGVQIERGGAPGPIRQLWESQPFDGPDGFWIARSGRFYIALAGSNQLVVVSSNGAELERFPSLPGTGDNGSSVPFDTPSSVMFLAARLMVANQSYFTGNTANQAILDVEAGERGQPEFIPSSGRHRRRHRGRTPRSRPPIRPGSFTG